MTAQTTHADALAAIERALEVEGAATPGEWFAHDVAEWIKTTPTWEVAYIAPEDPPLVGGEEVAIANYVDEADARAIVLARALVRPALLGAKEALDQHAPVDPTTSRSQRRCWGCADLGQWPCPDARRALDLVGSIPEGGVR